MSLTIVEFPIGVGPNKPFKVPQQVPFQNRFTNDNSKYLRTAVIKQAASKQSVIIADTKYVLENAIEFINQMLW